MTQVLGIALIDVRRLAVGDEQHQALLGWLLTQVMAGMAQGGAHAGAQATLHARQARLGQVIVGLIEILEAEVLNVVTAIRGETMDGEGVADAIDGPGQQPGGLAGQAQDSRTFLIVLVDALVGGLGQVEQDQHCQVAHVAGDANVDAGVRHDAAADVDHGPHRGVEVQFLPLLVATAAHHPLGLEGVDQVADARGQGAVAGQQFIHRRRVAQTLAALQDGGPIGPVELHLMIPFLIVAGVGDRLLALRLVVADAQVLVGKELGPQDPDLLGIVAGGLHVHLVDELHEADVLAHLALAEGNVVDAAAEELGLVEGPEEAVVVPVGQGPVLQQAQAGQGRLPPQGVIKGDAGVPTDAVVPGAVGQLGMEIPGGGKETLILFLGPIGRVEEGLGQA